MECKAVRAKPDETDDGRPCVALVMGNMRAVGCINEVAWSNLPPGMAREIAADLISAADDVERLTK